MEARVIITREDLIEANAQAAEKQNQAHVIEKPQVIDRAIADLCRENNGIPVYENLGEALAIVIKAIAYGKPLKNLNETTATGFLNTMLTKNGYEITQGREGNTTAMIKAVAQGKIGTSQIKTVLEQNVHRSGGAYEYSTGQNPEQNLGNER